MNFVSHQLPVVLFLGPFEPEKHFVKCKGLCQNSRSCWCGMKYGSGTNWLTVDDWANDDLLRPNVKKLFRFLFYIVGFLINYEQVKNLTTGYKYKTHFQTENSIKCRIIRITERLSKFRRAKPGGDLARNFTRIIWVLMEIDKFLVQIHHDR